MLMSKSDILDKDKFYYCKKIDFWNFKIWLLICSDLGLGMGNVSFGDMVIR